MKQEKKESFWAYLFMISLGGLGVHKFYLRKPYMGTLYICTFGLFGLGFIYDFFTLPFQVANANKDLDIEEQTQMHTEEVDSPQKKCCCTCNQ